MFKAFVQMATNTDFSRTLTVSARRLAWASLLVLSGLGSQVQAQNGQALQDIAISTLPGERVQLTFRFSRAAPTPLAFTIEDPARIALDFPDTRNELKQRSQAIGIGVARSISTAEAQGRTRAVLNLSQLTTYEAQVVGNDVILTLGNAALPGAGVAAASPFGAAGGTEAAAAPRQRSITSIDFRRGKDGEGRVVVGLSDPNIPVNLSDEAGRIVLDFTGTQLPKELERRLEVTDFATPAQTVDTFRRDGNVRMVINTGGKYEQLAYQSDNLFTIEIKPVAEEVAAARAKEEFSGERLSLNFQDIEVRSVLQLIADFTGLNVVVSDSVTGSLTLRLKNVPWDQALDIIMKTKGLAMRQTGNVLLIAPTEEIAVREKLELESQKQVQELAPLRSEFIQVNYARANDIASLLKAQSNSLLTERGSVTIDPRTNMLLVQETDAKLAEVRNLVRRLDVPVKQVLIESRIVIASDNFTKELGVRFGATGVDENGGNVVGVTGSAVGASDLVTGYTGAPFPAGLPSLNDRLISNLAVAPSGRIALALLSDNFMLDLELSAAQAESKAEVVSSPRVITSNQTKARIEQGVEVPYQQATSSGATSVAFKKAVLSLDVTPNITPDNRVFLDLEVNKDSVGQIFSGIPSIDTRKVQTQVLVDNGQTIVLGGIYEQTTVDAVEKVPFFGDIPLLGRLFRADSNRDEKSELLIFVTPKISEQGALSLAR